MLRRVPLDPKNPPKLCKNCKHFIVPPPNHPIKNGLCRKSGMIDLVDGDVIYDHASVVRYHKCKGTLWESLDG